MCDSLDFIKFQSFEYEGHIQIENITAILNSLTKDVKYTFSVDLKLSPESSSIDNPVSVPLFRPNLDITFSEYRISEAKFLRMFLILTIDNFSEEMSNKLTISVLNRNKQTFKSFILKFFILSARNVFSFPLVMKIDTILKNNNIELIDDCLTVRIHISFSRQLTPPVNPVEELNSDIKSLYETGENSDATISVGDKVLKVHKCILSARSSVFAGMFRHCMTETETNNVEIVDFDFDTMNELLRFVYTGKVKFSPKLTMPLMQAAEKYDLQTLKQMCIKNLKNDINVDNCSEALALADLYSCPELRLPAMDFIVNNIDKVIDTEDFEGMILTNPKLMKEITLALFDNKKQ